MKSGVYCITNKLNGKCYIGSSVDIAVRWRDHRYGIGSKILFAAFQKHGEHNFDFRVLEHCAPELMRAAEQKWISSVNPEYNIQRVVEGYFKHSAQTIAKMKATHAGKCGKAGGEKLRGRKRDLSPDARARMGRKGVSNPCSTEKALAISAAKKGKPLSEKHREALKQAWIKRKEKTSVRTKSSEGP